MAKGKRKATDSSKVDNTLNADAATRKKLSHTLGITEDEVKAMLASKGSDGPPALSRRALQQAPSAQEEVKAPTMSAAWADFMDDDCADVEVDLSAKQTKEGGVKENAKETKANPNAKYELPVRSSLDECEGKFGVLAQTGTLDTDTVGRMRKTVAEVGAFDLSSPTVLSPAAFGGKLVAFLATSATACHSIAVTEDGTPYGWGRNEASQLGNSEEQNILTPTVIKGPWGSSKIVAAAVGKSHTVMVDEEGKGWAAGKNDVGQLGINNISETNVSAFKACKFGSDYKEAKLVKVACGENFTLGLDDEGYLYSAGNSEYGTLGNGETGEHFVTASKIAFNPSPRFMRRNTFVRREFNFKENEEPKVLDDSFRIKIAQISCGKSHAVAVEAAREGHTSRVFSWGCGNYGTLGHKVQKDEYFPRQVESLTGPMFKANQPVDVVCGSTCCIVKTSQGHGYYWGKHKTGGEAAMLPLLLDFLANNSHVVGAYGCGNAHVTLATTEQQTVTYGQGPHGELGFGVDGAKSSAQPKFIDSLDDIDVLQVGCGYGHTAFVLKKGKQTKKLDVFEGEGETKVS